MHLFYDMQPRIVNNSLLRDQSIKCKENKGLLILHLRVFLKRQTV